MSQFRKCEPYQVEHQGPQNHTCGPAGPLQEVAKTPETFLPLPPPILRVIAFAFVILTEQYLLESLAVSSF